MHDSFDEKLRQPIERLKRRDADRAPSFDSILNRRAEPQPSRLDRRVTWVAAVTALLVFAFLMFGNTLFQPEPIAENKSENQTETADGNIDFAALHASIDACFESLVNEPMPKKIDWNVPSDALLAVNLGEETNETVSQ